MGEWGGWNEDGKGGKNLRLEDGVLEMRMGKGQRKFKVVRWSGGKESGKEG